ncbi:MAG: hypothetical protein N3E37_02345 [Candidatus Micrarchaeota archaeon]|nr:hypothetical protein [Candidatus Micrarchaeota archaeon]
MEKFVEKSNLRPSLRTMEKFVEKSNLHPSLRNIIIKYKIKPLVSDFKTFRNIWFYLYDPNNIEQDQLKIWLYLALDSLSNDKIIHYLTKTFNVRNLEYHVIVNGEKLFPKSETYTLVSHALVKNMVEREKLSNITSMISCLIQYFDEKNDLDSLIEIFLKTVYQVVEFHNKFESSEEVFRYCKTLASKNWYNPINVLMHQSNYLILRQLIETLAKDEQMLTKFLTAPIYNRRNRFDFQEPSEYVLLYAFFEKKNDEILKVLEKTKVNKFMRKKY